MSRIVQDSDTGGEDAEDCGAWLSCLQKDQEASRVQVPSEVHMPETSRKPSVPGAWWGGHWSVESGDERWRTVAAVQRWCGNVDPTRDALGVLARDNVGSSLFPRGRGGGADTQMWHPWTLPARPWGLGGTAVGA